MAANRGATAPLLKKLQKGPQKVNSFSQRQLVNTTRYRNILRYQLGAKSIMEPLVAIVSDDNERQIREPIMQPNSTTDRTRRAIDVSTSKITDETEGNRNIVVVARPNTQSLRSQVGFTADNDDNYDDDDDDNLQVDLANEEKFGFAMDSNRPAPASAA